MGILRRPGVPAAVGAPAGGVARGSVRGGRKRCGDARPGGEQLVAHAGFALLVLPPVVGGGAVAAGSAGGVGIAGHRGVGAGQAGGVRGGADPPPRGAPGLGVRPGRASEGERGPGGGDRDAAPRPGAGAAAAPTAAAPVGGRPPGVGGGGERGARRAGEPGGAAVGPDARVSGAGGRGCRGPLPDRERGVGALVSTGRPRARPELAGGDAGGRDHGAEGPAGRRAARAALLAGVGADARRRELPRRAVLARRGPVGGPGVASDGEGVGAERHPEHAAPLLPRASHDAGARAGRGGDDGGARGRGGVGRGGVDRGGPGRPAAGRPVVRRGRDVGRGLGGLAAGVRARRRGDRADHGLGRREDDPGDVRDRPGVVRADAGSAAGVVGADADGVVGAGRGDRAAGRAGGGARPVQAPQGAVPGRLRDVVADPVRLRPLRRGRRRPHPHPRGDRVGEVVPPQLPAHAGARLRPAHPHPRPRRLLPAPHRVRGGRVHGAQPGREPGGGVGRDGGLRPPAVRAAALGADDTVPGSVGGVAAGARGLRGGG